MPDFIAQRTLLYSEKNTSQLKRMTLKLSQPFYISEDMDEYPCKDCFACKVYVEGIDIRDDLISYGADEFQAINLATDVDSLIKRMSKYYDFFWEEGESYFEE